MALYVATNVSVVKPQLGFHDIEGPRGTLDTIASVRAKGEVGVQRDTQGFRGPVQRSHCITDSHLRVESGLVGIGCEEVHSGFLGSNEPMTSCLSSAHFTSMAQSWLALAFASACTILAAEASRVKSSA